MHFIYFQYIMLPYFPVYNTFMFTIYAFIIRVVRQHAAQIRAQDEVVSREAAYQQYQQREMRLLRTSGIVFITFFVSWLPYVIIISVQIYGDMLIHESLQTARVAAVFISAVNSAVNPVIYTLKLPAFRNEIKNLFWRRSKPSTMNNGVYEPDKY